MSVSIQKLGRRLRLAVIGGGPDSFIGSIHRSAATMHEEFEVVAGVVSSNPERSIQAAESMGLRGYGSPEALFSAEAERQDGADVIAIMTPNNSHYDLSVQALEHGFHVMCEKPLTMNVEEADALVSKAKEAGKCYCVAYGYTGYPMVRQARAMIEQGILGEIKMLQSQYIQGHLAELTPSEKDGTNWHMKPELAGPSLILGDIATHSYHLLSYVSGMVPQALSADVTALVDGREADDYCGIQLRYANQARGQLFVTQAAAGGVHGLSFTIFGSKGGLEWNQEQPNELLVRPIDAPAYVLTKGGKGLLPEAERVSHVAIGHPEGYREAFANLYFDLAHHIVALEQGESPDPLCLSYPSIEEGAEGMAFVYSSLESRDSDSQWTSIRDHLQN
ncbi:putative oxidoreductase [Vibrio nigripulchritudo SO65]|uniref:Gfo/Idh/MocA family protein n=1 Tax=Vibrio nigripulchritudo TaxID=28173 RepID=UPI0003B23B15|nr:Gfo/Idh/MocA family oxidoreductase [Vibrio nigripulchritudo]CCN33201.1 putative oxidoreductase [Vibrio nigripulchritudo AM115]CCN41655.1 putative oxidoreductase [Vibrio nigripulchritudo FTn2]CCN78510.1 putative oxidoreductase [Vibrio nigripulchritudo SO65]